MGYLRKSKVILLALLIWIACFAGIEASAENEDNTVDFVLVLDCSGSMNTSDNEMMSIEAAKCFLDLIPIENARVGIVGFGPNWGEESYVYEKNGTVRDLTVYGGTHTIQAYPLSYVSEEEKQGVKDTITEIMSQRDDESYTTVGYALQAAMDMLEENDTPSDQACVILMSDGRLTDTVSDLDLYEEDGIRHSHSLDGALEQATAKGWPIYCIELAFDADSEHQINKWLIPTGTYQMNRIAEETGGKKVTAVDEKQMIELLTEVFQRFIRGEGDENNSTLDREVVEIQDGQATGEIAVESMTAEMDIIIEGQGLADGEMLADSVDRIEIINPEGTSVTYSKTEYSESRMITFEDGYIMAKLVQPKEGTWKVVVHGTNGVSIQFTKIAMHELNLMLRTQENKTSVGKGDEIEFLANFYYNDNAMSSGTFYTDYAAYLENVDTHEKLIDMTGEENRYVANYSFDEVGTFQVRAVVESGVFRNDRIVSDVINIEVTEQVSETTQEEETADTAQVSEAETTIEAEPQSSKGIDIKTVFIVIAAIIIVLILIRMILTWTFKEIPGTWEVTVNGKVRKNPMKLGSKVKSKYSIDEILEGFTFTERTGCADIVLKAKGKRVIIVGLENVQNLVYNGRKCDTAGENKTKKSDLTGKNSYVQFDVSGLRVKIKRSL